MTYATFEAVADRVAQLPAGSLVAIDGLSVSGKSTLAGRLAERLGLEVVWLDEFVMPERLWPAGRTPAFPFPYIRYPEFMAAVAALAAEGRAEYLPFDWSSGEIAATPRTVTAERPVLVEGVSSLHPALSPLYALKLFVDSNRATTLAAAVERGVGDWLDAWRDWFLPCADIYFATGPAARADLLVAGRGAAKSRLE